MHRDLKPSNIFLARTPWGDRFPKVLDFGISKLIGDTQGGALTGTRTVLGTAAYMSPEQTRGAREIDGRSDQYSLELILYEALTGRRAHDGDHALEVLHNIANGIFKAPRQVRRLLRKCLEKDPSKRLRDIGDAWELLEVDSTRMDAAVPNWRRLLPWALAGVLAVTILALLLVPRRQWTPRAAPPMTPRAALPDGHRAGRCP